MRTCNFLLAVTLLFATAVACGTTATAPTPDTQATVDAAIQATSAAQVALQATVDAAVQATVVAAPTVTSSVEYVTMTEEELAALIDQAVAEAMEATVECSEATGEASSDDTVTQEEADEIETYVLDAEQAVAYAEELIGIYYDLYGELAMETLTTLQAVEQDLVLIAESLAMLNATLQEVDATLAQGLALAEETIAQLENTAQVAEAKAAEAHARAQTWVQELEVEREARVAQALAVVPDSVAGTRPEALRAAFDYVDAVRQALGDNAISQQELTHIAQLGANASAGLEASGGPQLRQFGGSINQITAQLAQGQPSHALDGLGGLEAQLGPRPARP